MYLKTEHQTSELSKTDIMIAPKTPQRQPSTMDSAEAKSKAVKPPQGGKAPKGSKSKSRPKKSQGLAESQAKNQNENNDQSKQAHEVQEPESNDQPKQAHEVQKPENDNMQESGKKDESKKVPEAQKAQLVKSGRLPRGQLRDWSSYTPNPPTKAELKANGRQKGRILIPWGRKCPSSIA